MLHQSSVVSDTAQMKMVNTVAVPERATVTFEPGGYHLMCVSPTAALSPGHGMPVTLRFQDGSALNTTFPVFGAKGK
jgi:hypothetical protein